MNLGIKIIGLCGAGIAMTLGWLTYLQNGALTLQFNQWWVVCGAVVAITAGWYTLKGDLKAGFQETKLEFRLMDQKVEIMGDKITDISGHVSELRRWKEKIDTGEFRARAAKGDG